MAKAPAASAAERDPLAAFACPNPDCDLFNRFNAGNLSVAERMGKDHAIRRLYCHHCGQRFSERQGSLLHYTKLPEDTVVRIIKCLGHGCSLEATADICEVDARTVARMLAKAGRRAEDFHRLHLEQLAQPLGAVEVDELHGTVAKPPGVGGKKGRQRNPLALLRDIARWVETGFTRPWR
jgi:transposase-like protein